MRNYGVLNGPNGEPILILDPTRDEEDICDGFL
jgi:hypothetical protein